MDSQIRRIRMGFSSERIRGICAMWGQINIPKGHYSKQIFIPKTFLFWKFSIPKGHFSDTQVYRSSLYWTVLSQWVIIPKCFIPKGHHSEVFLFPSHFSKRLSWKVFILKPWRVIIPKDCYSERSLLQNLKY